VYQDKTDVSFKIGRSSFKYNDKHVFMDGKKYKATQGLWELLTKSKPDKNTVTFQDRHISKYSQSLVPHVRTKRTKESSIRALFHNSLLKKGSSLGICVMSVGKIYYDPKHTAGFSSAAKLVSAAKSINRNVEEWLSGQDAYTLHKPVRKRFPRNPYTVTNVDGVWEIDLADLSSLSRYNYKYKYLRCNRHIFTLCLERTSKGQDRHVNRSGFNNFISK